MAPLPKRRHSTARSGKRKGVLTIPRVLLVRCPICGKSKEPHQFCPACGHYNNRLILSKKTDKKKEGRKKLP